MYVDRYVIFIKDITLPSKGESLGSPREQSYSHYNIVAPNRREMQACEGPQLPEIVHVVFRPSYIVFRPFCNI